MALDNAASSDDLDLTEMTARIVSAFVSRNSIATSDVPVLIADISDALKRMGQQEVEAEPQEPAVPIRKSVKPDSIACLECGKGFKSLKRHIRTEHQLEPDDYRAKWGLKNDYPMVAPNYAETRSKLARDMGLGRKPAEAAQPEKATRRGKQAKRGGAAQV